MIPQTQDVDHRFRRVPLKLRNLNQWFCWQNIGGRKLPKTVDGRDGKSNDPTMFSNFETAAEASRQFSGLAFIIQRDDGLTGVDLDNCLDENGMLRDWAIPVVLKLESVSYGEISPSGNGIKFLTYASKPDGAKSVHKICGTDGRPLGGKQQIECYDFNRFWAVTGDVYGDSETPSDGQVAIDWLTKQYLTTPPQKPQAKSVVVQAAEYRDSADDLSRRVDAYLAKCQVPAEGDRNNTVFGVAGNAKAIVDVYGNPLGDDELVERVTAWGGDCGLSPAELETTIRSGLTNGTPREKKYPNNHSEGFVDEYPLNSGTNRANVDSIPELKAEPFPVDALPDRFRQMAESVSEAVGVDVSFAVLPMFTVCSTAIGNSRWVSTKSGNSQPLMLWTAVVGSSGSQKSEPFSHAEEPIREIDSEVIRAWQESLAGYEEQLKLYKLDFSEWKKERQGEMPAEPLKPPKARLVLTDFTYESMVESHAGTPRGITISCEELSAWFGSFDRYNGKGAASPEQARYLQAYDGKCLTSDRISGFRFVPRAFLNVSGTIQPGILAKCFTDESRQNGLASRLWMTYPEARPIKWTDTIVSPTAKSDYRKLVRELWELRPSEIDSDKWPVPTSLPFNREAQCLFAEFFNRTGQDAFSAAEDAKAAMTKFIGRCARLAGVLHCCEQVNGDAMDAFEIQPETVERAIRISEWSLSEAHRIYRLLTEPDEVRHLRGIAGWIRHQGGRMTARDVARNRRDIETTEQADLVLIQLVKAGLGTWQPIHKSREFVLNSEPVSTNTP